MSWLEYFRNCWSSAILMYNYLGGLQSMSPKGKNIQLAAVLWAKMSPWCQRSDENGQIGFFWAAGNSDLNNFPLQLSCTKKPLHNRSNQWTKTEFHTIYQSWKLVYSNLLSFFKSFCKFWFYFFSKNVLNVQIVQNQGQSHWNISSLITRILQKIYWCNLFQQHIACGCLFCTLTCIKY